MKASLKETYDKWQVIISQWEASGLSQPKFCQMNQVNVAKLKYYRHKLRSIHYGAPSVKAIPLEAHQPPSFEPVAIISAPLPRKESIQPKSQASLVDNYFKVTLPNGLLINIPSDYVPASLVQLMEVLRQC